MAAGLCLFWFAKGQHTNAEEVSIACAISRLNKVVADTVAKSKCVVEVLPV
jgi:hypothetical protein